MKDYLRRTQARWYFRKRPTAWLTLKRARLAARILGIEDVLAERGYGALPAGMRAVLAVMLKDEKEDAVH